MINYNFIQKLLHDIYLKNKFIKKSLYEIEKIVFLDSEVKNLENANHVFITGLPRSGSTLIESIISSGKRKILNGGETAIINRVFLDNNKKFFSQKKILDSSQRLKIDKKTFIKKVIDQYQLINLLSDNNDCTFTDKSLENFFFIELIIKLFPESKIIICKRKKFLYRL